MQESTLEKIAFVIAIFGLLSIVLITQNYNLEKIPISEVNEKDLDLEVYIEGYITKVVNTESVTILNVKDDSGLITVVTFGNKESNKFYNGQKISVKGKVATYKGTLEIIANKIISV